MSTLSARYASHNDYINFRRVVHYAQYPENKAPPVPHSRTWFPRDKGSPADSASPAASPARRRPPRGRAPLAADSISSDEDEDDMVEAVIERLSIKCPITLVPMMDPVSTSKCPHSFEKEAIMGMIRASTFEVQGGPHGPDRKKAVRCPVCEAVRLIYSRSMWKFLASMNILVFTLSRVWTTAHSLSCAGPYSQ